MKQRKPLAKLNSESQFVGKSDIGGDLKLLSLEELAQRYVSIEQQSQFYKGLILLEARDRFASDKQFGEWVVTHGLSVGTSQQNRTLYMNLARFFKDRDMTGISLTCAYEISKPSNSDIADDLYAQAINKNFSVSEIKQKVTELKNKAGIPLVTNNQQPVSVFVLAEELQLYEDIVLEDIKDLVKKEAISVLKSCLKKLQD